MRILSRLLAVALAAIPAIPAAAQQWPARVIRIVTGTPAGGSPDFVSRLLAEKLSERLRQSVLGEKLTKTRVAARDPVPKGPPPRFFVSRLTGAFFGRAAGAQS